MDRNVKSANVAFQKDYLTAFFAQIGFEIIQEHKGYWSGLEKANCRDFQDIIVLQKK